MDLQHQVYSEEIAILNMGKRLPRSNKLYYLEAFVDHDGLLKVGGRLSDTSVSNSITHPVVITKEHHLTKLLIADRMQKLDIKEKALH